MFSHKAAGRAKSLALPAPCVPASIELLRTVPRCMSFTSADVSESLRRMRIARELARQSASEILPAQYNAEHCARQVIVHDE